MAPPEEAQEAPASKGGEVDAWPSPGPDDAPAARRTDAAARDRRSCSDLLADRLGKSGMAAALVVAPAVLGREGGDLQHILAKTAFGVAGVWFLASLRLVRVISSSSEPRGKVLTGAAT